MRKGSHLNVKELSAYFMLVPYSASAGRFRSTFVLGRLDKDHFSDWPGLLPTHRVLFFLTKLPHNKTSQTRLESWDVLLISPPPRSVRERGYRRASEEEIARECHSSALRWGDENGLLLPYDSRRSNFDSVGKSLPSASHPTGTRG